MVEVIEKTFSPKIEKRSVVETPSVTEHQSPHAHSLVLQVAQAAQTISPWGYDPRTRDKELRSFWHSESWLAAVVYLVSIRNASYVWTVQGSDPEKPRPKNTIRAVSRVLNNSNKGRGWQDLVKKTCIDLYTQDNAAFWEIIRSSNKMSAPVINISHLDSAKCLRTGDPKNPVIYTKEDGTERILRHWEVRTLEEFPSPIETAYNLQYCAVTRALIAAEIVRDISVYNLEKVSGNFTRAIDIVSGVTKRNIDDAIGLSEEQNLNKGLYYYSLPVILPGVDPTSSLSHVHIDLASLPDNFDADTSFKWYVAQLAASFGVDYQEIAPLMTGSLGSSQQSEIMHLKTRGKGPAVIMGLFENTINGLFPDIVEFKFLEQDLRTESEKAEATFTRVKARAMQIKSGELSPAAARELAVIAGDMPRWLANEVEDQLDNPERSSDEFGPTQIESGVDTQMTMKDVQNIRDAISNSPLGFMNSFSKSSIGTPSGTFIATALDVPLSGIQHLEAELLMQFSNTRTRFVEKPYHVTLVHSPLVDFMEFGAINEFVATLSTKMPFTVSASRLSHFDTETGQAIVLLVDENAELKLLQTEIYQRFVDLGIPVGEFSSPENWVPHITLAYVDKDIQVPDDRDIDPVRFIIQNVLPSRSCFTLGT